MAVSAFTVPAKFFAGWLPIALASAAVDPAPRLADLFVFTAAGAQVPPVTCLLGAIGVLAARPLARRKSESELGLGGFVIVSILMLITVELWVIEHRPGALFAFVIAIGLGFSGYSLIELLGQEMRSIVSSKAKAIADQFGGNKDKGSRDGK